MPITFSGLMVNAILQGRKVQTRRVAKLTSGGHVKEKGGYRRWHPGDPEASKACPYGKPGDHLWVRESFNWAADYELLPGENHLKCPERQGWQADNVVWRADGERTHPEWGKALWRPSIHLPRWASRVNLKVTDVHIQRLQEISEDDAIDEGVGMFDAELFNHATGDFCQASSLTPVERFGALWDSINAKKGHPWSSNPWVWVVHFYHI